MRIVRSSFTLFLCFSMVAFFSGCSDDTTNPNKDSGLCAADEECPLGWYCDVGVCRQADATCDDTHPCPSGQECRNGGCVAVATDGGVDGDGGDGGDGGEPEPGPDIEIVEPPLTGDPPLHQLNFGNVMVGVTASRQVRVSNVGDADLQILQLNFEACQGIDDFSVPADQLAALPVTVAPGGSTVFDVDYTASDGLTDHCILDIVSNDPDEALVKVHLLSEFKGNALASVQPQSLNFGDIPLTETSQPLTFTLSNQGTGNAVLTVEEIRFGILSNPDFSMTISDSGGQPAVIPAQLNNGDFLDVEVVYHPQVEEQDSDEAVITTDDPINTTLRVTLTGQGVVGILDVSPSPVDVGRVRVGEHGEAVVTITNTGGAPTALAEVYLWDAGPELSLTSPDLDLANLPTNPYQLGPSESARVEVNFDPIDIGAEEASLIVENTSEDWYRVIAVTAEGFIPAQVETDPSPPALIFGNVQFDLNSGNAERKELVVDIRNAGQEPLQINNIATAAMTSLEFTYDPAAIPPIGVGQEAPLSVFFEPINSGGEIGGILVDTNDPDIDLDGVTGRFRIDMQATGIDPEVLITPVSGHNFGDVYVGMQVERDVSIRNAGTGPLEIQSIALTPGSSSKFTLVNLPALPMTISNPMTEVIFQVRYLPDSMGTDSGAIEIETSDIGNLSVILDLLGSGADCPANTIDCDGDPSNGCETPCINYGAEVCNQRDDDCDCQTDEDFDLDTDPYNCGTCNNNCTDDYPHAEGGCVNGSCFLLHCDDGWDNCDAWNDNGCEVDTDNDIANCGSCTNHCSFDNAAASCLGGVCVMGSCDSGWLDCNSSDADGCEVDRYSDPDNCGNCGSRCVYLNGVGICMGGFCHLDSCVAGYDDCDNNEATGCEINTNTDVNNCGFCDNVCPSGTGTPICNNGSCEISQCSAGLADCDANPADCETNIRDGDPNNCNGCGIVCDLPNAVEDCVNYTCVVDSCDTGWGNCDSQDPNGCETDTTSDINNCNTCGNVCAFDHAAASCVSSQCIMGACDPGYYDVDGLTVNGCECGADTVSDLCDDATITNLGQLNDGAVVNVTANIVPNGDEDWYTFTAPDNNANDINAGGDDYHLHIVFSGGGEPGGIYYDLYRKANTSTTCAGKGSPICLEESQNFDWLYHCDQTAWPDSCGAAGGITCTCFNNTARYWIRVYRKAAHTVTCNAYQISISFTQ